MSQVDLFEFALLFKQNHQIVKELPNIEVLTLNVELLIVIELSQILNILDH
jgi:hypothetical protein